MTSNLKGTYVRGSSEQRVCLAAGRLWAMMDTLVYLSVPCGGDK